MNRVSPAGIVARTKFKTMLASRWLKPRVTSEIFRRGRSRRDDFISAVYVINLDRQENRWRRYKKEARFVRLHEGGSLIDLTRRFPAIDARQFGRNPIVPCYIDSKYRLSEQYFVEQDERLLPILKGREIEIVMTPQEIAVAQSHIGVWKKIVEDQCSYALILEDDIYFDEAFATLTNKAWHEFSVDITNDYRFDVFYVSYREPKEGATKRHVTDHLFRPVRGLWQLSGYIVSYRGAQRLLDLMPIRGPVDLWINHQFDKLDVFAMRSSLIHQRFDLKSDNSYSIIPILAELGIKSEESPLRFEKQIGRKPVFAIGLSAEEGDRLSTALSLLGYRTCFVVGLAVEEHLGLGDWKGSPFDAFVNVPYVEQSFRTLDARYHDALFVVSGTVGVASTNSYPTASLATGVMSHFCERPRKVLVLGLRGEVTWEKLCAFLGCPVPEIEFPALPAPALNGAQRQIRRTVATTAQGIRIKKQDDYPWIMPRRASFGGFAVHRPDGASPSDHPVRSFTDRFGHFDRSRWELRENSFPSNLVQFDTRNFNLTDGGGFRMTLKKQNAYDRKYTSASLVAISEYLYGRFDVEMKPAKGKGVISAFFLHRFNPRQEIDIEFLGQDTTSLLANVYYNPGHEGTAYNYGNRGTPIAIPLGFNASEDFHGYAIEWTPDEIRWLVDGKPVHIRPMWGPTPIPDLPMKFFVNLWSCRHKDLGGRLDERSLPLHADVRAVALSRL